MSCVETLDYVGENSHLNATESSNDACMYPTIYLGLLYFFPTMLYSFHI